MIKYGIRNLRQHKGMHSLILVLLVCAFLVAVYGSCAAQLKLGKYACLKSVLSKNGYVVMSNTLLKEDNGVVITDQQLLELCPGAEQVVTMSGSWGTEYINREPVNLITYSETMTQMYAPEMESGRWFQASDRKQPVLKGIITHNNGRYRTGDVVELSASYRTGTIEVEIIGVVEDGADILCDTEEEKHNDYRDCFLSYSYEENNEIPALILSQGQIYGNDAFRFLQSGQEGSVTQPVNCLTFILYPDTADNASVDADIARLQENSILYSVVRTSDMDKNSREYILGESLVLIPVLAGILVYVLTMSVSIEVITVMKNRKRYRIYYQEGLTKGQCAGINAVSTCVLGIAAAAIVLFILWVNPSGIFSEVWLGKWQILGCIGIEAVLWLSAMLVPRFLIRSCFK